MTNEETTVTPATPNEDSFGDAWDEDAQSVEAPLTPAATPPAAAAPEAVPAVEEPAAAQPASTQPAAATPDDDSAAQAEQRRLANESSMQGRLEAERRKTADLEAQLRAAQARANATPAQQNADQSASSTAAFGKPILSSSVDEDTRILVDEFSKANPELAPLIVEDSKDGERMRRILGEYGADHTATAAEFVIAKRNVLAAEAQRVQAARAEVVVRHYNTLAENHPEFAEALIGVSDEARQQRAEFTAQIQEWVGRLPYDQGLYASNVLKGGTTAQVSFVIGEFKKSLAPAAPVAPAAPQSLAATQPAVAQGASDNAQRIRRAAEAGIAVPARSAPTLPISQPDKDDFSAAFDEE